jgi:hypothetical protein
MKIIKVGCVGAHTVVIYGSFTPAFVTFLSYFNSRTLYKHSTFAQSNNKIAIEVGKSLTWNGLVTADDDDGRGPQIIITNYVNYHHLFSSVTGLRTIERIKFFRLIYQSQVHFRIPTIWIWSTINHTHCCCCFKSWLLLYSVVLCCFINQDIIQMYF